MKNNTHKLDCSKRYRQDEIDLWVASWGSSLVGFDSDQQSKDHIDSSPSE